MTDTAHPTTAARLRAMSVIVTAAFAVKLVVLWQLWDHPLLQPHGELDTAYYVDLSERIALEGVLAPVGAFVVSPLYVYFLAAVFAAGGTTLAAQLIQIGLGSAAVGLLFATTRHWFGERAASVAAALAILTGFFTFNEVLILQSALDPFLASLALYALTRTVAGGGTFAFAAAGAALGLFALNRPNALVFAVTAAAGVCIIQWRAAARQERGPLRWRARISNPSVLAACLLTVFAANAARNYAVSGDAVMIASHGGLNFYIGNHDRADGTYTPVPGIRPSIAGQAGDSTRVAEARAGRSLSPTEVSDSFTQQAIDWMAGHPADAARLWIRKAGILLNRVDVPLNYSYAFYVREPNSFLRFLAVGPWLLLPLGLAGLFWPALRVRHGGYWIWAMFVPVYGASVILFFVADRYRMPLLLPLCVSAGAALARLFDLARARRLASLVVPVTAIAIAAVIVFADLGLDDGRGGEQTRKAVLFVEQGALDEARRYVARIADEHPHPGILRFRVGQALLDAGRYEDAADFLNQAMSIDGPQPAIRLGLGQALVGAGRAPEAVAHLAAAYDGSYEIAVAGPQLVRALVFAGRVDEAITRLSRWPTSLDEAATQIALDFGTLALERSASVEATRWLAVAVARSPANGEAHEKLGLAIFMEGDLRAALPHLERACQLDPARASAFLNLAVVYAELGRFADARTQAMEATRLDPTEPRAADLLKALPK